GRHTLQEIRYSYNIFRHILIAAELRYGGCWFKLQRIILNLVIDFSSDCDNNTPSAKALFISRLEKKIVKSVKGCGPFIS
ncbi:MAG TPA: hypothetical protein VK369_14595, partial [Segetibacter sp.]|nr:hypothetical protein [Segetibacter sp.]